jgi:phosphatidylserine decarboxylase
VLVGATIVGSMATAWHGVVTPPRRRQVQVWRYADRDIRLAKGEEMGRFLVGSTVVLLFSKASVRLNRSWVPGLLVRLGEAMGEAGA